MGVRNAGVMGHPQAFETLIAWAQDADSVVRQSGPGSADLGDAVRTSYYIEATAELADLRRRAVAALLALVDREEVGRWLCVILSRDSELRATLENELRDAIARGISMLADQAVVEFDLAPHVASLIRPLAKLDDQAAAICADRLLDIKPWGQHVLAELADALGGGSGPATLSRLDRLAALGLSHAKKVLEYRRRAAASRSS